MGFGKERGGPEMEGEESRGDKNKRQQWIARRLTERKAERREKMEKMRKRGQ